MDLRFPACLWRHPQCLYCRRKLPSTRSVPSWMNWKTSWKNSKPKRKSSWWQGELGRKADAFVCDILSFLFVSLALWCADFPVNSGRCWSDAWRKTGGALVCASERTDCPVLGWLQTTSGLTCWGKVKYLFRLWKFRFLIPVTSWFICYTDGGPFSFLFTVLPLAEKPTSFSFTCSS